VVVVILGLRRGNAALMQSSCAMGLFVIYMSRLIGYIYPALAACDECHTSIDVASRSPIQ